MSEFTQFITENMYIVAAVLYVLGVFLKSIPTIPDWTIPFILTAIGIAFGVALIGIPQGILEGVLCAGAAVLVNQMVKQAQNAKEEEGRENERARIAPCSFFVIGGAAYPTSLSDHKGAAAANSALKTIQYYIT